VIKPYPTYVNRIKNYRTSERLALGAAMAGNLLSLPLASQAAAYSFTDLNPSGFGYFAALGISSSQQVGEGYGSGNDYHALLWSGTAGSVVDLHSFLSSNYSSSETDGIDANGNIVGQAFFIPTGKEHAILWTIVPEPGSMTLLALGGVALLLRKRF
jgi:PEP-CTERM motif